MHFIFSGKHRYSPHFLSDASIRHRERFIITHNVYDRFIWNLNRRSIINSSALADHVVGIVLESTEKEMSWVDALWIIARMEDAKPIGDRPAIKKIRKPVSTPMRANSAECPFLKSSVSPGAGGKHPFPAFSFRAKAGSSVYPTPKKFLRLLLSVFSHAANNIRNRSMGQPLYYCGDY